MRVAWLAAALLALAALAVAHIGDCADGQCMGSTGMGGGAGYARSVGKGRQWSQYDMSELDFKSCGIERRSVKDLTPEQFQAEYGATSKPVILTDAMENWAAVREWAPAVLQRKYGHLMVDLEGEMTQLSRYIPYLLENNDFDPKYVFEEHFLSRNPQFTKHFSIPTHFGQDFFEVLPSNLRPPHKWMLLGPARSGSYWHFDPYNSSAWNALVSGRKRWAFYPPGDVIGPPGHHGVEIGASNMLCIGADCRPISAMDWYRKTYPHLREESKPIECVQEAGELLFVPTGWWHHVLNLTPTVAVTQNFCDVNNFKSVWEEMKRDSVGSTKSAQMSLRFLETWRDQRGRDDLFTEEDAAWAKELEASLAQRK